MKSKIILLFFFLASLSLAAQKYNDSRSEDLNIAKYAIDATNHRFASELVIAYKCDFNFVDKKDGMTLLDFVQERIEDQKRLTPPAEVLIQDYENLYKAIVRNGGKHAKDL